MHPRTDTSVGSAARSLDAGRSMQYPAPRVLLADGHGDTRALYETWLVQHGFSVASAASGDETLQRAQAQAPDVIVTELMLPGGGTHIIERLRTAPLTADALLIVLTSQNAVALRDQAIDAGADLYLVKPCGAARLGEVMASVSRARFERLAPRIDGERNALLRAAQRTFAIRERVPAMAALAEGAPMSRAAAD